MTTTDQKSLADQLRDAIRGCEWSLNSIARETGIPQPNLYRFMQGKCDVSLSTADKIARYFGMRLTRPKRV